MSMRSANANDSAAAGYYFTIFRIVIIIQNDVNGYKCEAIMSFLASKVYQTKKSCCY